MAATLQADVSHPESQEVLVSNWEPAHSLIEDAISGAEIAPFRLWLLFACIPASGGDGPVHCWLALLWYSLSPLFCEQSGNALG